MAFVLCQDILAGSNSNFDDPLLDFLNICFKTEEHVLMVYDKLMAKSIDYEMLFDLSEVDLRSTLMNVLNMEVHLVGVIVSNLKRQSGSGVQINPIINSAGFVVLSGDENQSVMQLQENITIIENKFVEWSSQGSAISDNVQSTIDEINDYYDGLIQSLQDERLAKLKSVEDLRRYKLDCIESWRNAATSALDYLKSSNQKIQYLLNDISLHTDEKRQKILDYFGSLQIEVYKLMLVWQNDNNFSTNIDIYFKSKLFSNTPQQVETSNARNTSNICFVIIILSGSLWITRYCNLFKKFRLFKKVSPKPSFSSKGSTFTSTSHIIRRDEEKKLVKWFYDDSNLKLNLLFRSSENGFTGQKFHELCNDQGRTLVIIETTDGRVIGGTTSQSWKNPGAYFDEMSWNQDNEWLFLLRKKNGVKSQRKYFAKPYFEQKTKISCVYSNEQDGPVFGYKNESDLRIVNGCNVNFSSFCFGKRYENSKPQDRVFFLVKEYEVWKIN